MNKSQHRLYLREWGKAWKAHWSGVRKGEPLARPDRKPSAMRDRVLQAAGMLAMRDESPLTAETIRHACHVVALGKDCGSWALRNKELDRVLAVFRLLANDANLGAQLRLDNPEIGARERMMHSIRNVDMGPAYVASISRDKFGTENWQSLDATRMQQLLMTIKARALVKQTANLKTAAVPSPA